MTIIERYISAYVIRCLFPETTVDGTHMQYVYEVLRETGSQPTNEILRNVLDFVRQGDPEDEYTVKMVRDYVRAMIIGGMEVQKKNQPLGQFYEIGEGVIAMTVTKDANLVALAGCSAADLEQLKGQLRGQFPGIVFQKLQA